MQNILAHARYVLLICVCAVAGCEQSDYSLESVQDGKRVLGIHVNGDGEYEFALCPKEAFTFTESAFIDYTQCLNPLVGSDGAPKTFSALPDKPNTLATKIQTGAIITATAIVAAGVAYWIGRYFTTIKAGKALGSDLFVERMDLALGALRGMDNLKIPPRLGKRVLNEEGLLKEEIRIALKHDYTLKTLKLRDGTILTDQKAINDEIVSWGTTKTDLVRDIGNLHKKTTFDEKPWGRELADSLSEGGDIGPVVKAEGMTKELYDTLHSNNLVVREVDGSFRFEEKIIDKIRRYEALTAKEFKQFKEVTSALSARKKLVTKIKKSPKITSEELNKTDEALAGLDGGAADAAKENDPLIALVKTSGIGGDDIEKIDDLLVSELRDLRRYLKDIRAHTGDKSTRKALKDLQKKVDQEIKSSSYLYAMKDTVRRKHAIKKGINGDVGYARESILSSSEVAGKEASMMSRLAATLRDTFKYKNAEGKFTTTVQNHDELVASLAKGEQFGKVRVDSGALKATTHLAGAGVFLSLATFKRNILPKYSLLEASKYWDALVGEMSPTKGVHTSDLYSVIKGLAIATESKVSDEVQYFFLHTGTAESREE